MSYIALNTAATGLSALSTSLDVTANNLANANTTAFKSSRVNFEDVYYQEMAQPGLAAGNATQRPTGLYVGLGVQAAGTQLDFTQGATETTGNPFDLLIEGDGFFEVQLPDDFAEGRGFTRAGNFTLNQDGELVMASSSGFRLRVDFTVPPEATDVSVGVDGIVTAVIPPNRAEKKTSPKMDMLTINILQNRGHRYAGKSLRIRNFHMLLHLT